MPLKPRHRPLKLVVVRTGGSSTSSPTPVSATTSAPTAASVLVTACATTVPTNASNQVSSSIPAAPQDHSSVPSAPPSTRVGSSHSNEKMPKTTTPVQSATLPESLTAASSDTNPTSKPGGSGLIELDEELLALADSNSGSPGDLSGNVSGVGNSEADQDTNKVDVDIQDQQGRGEQHIHPSSASSSLDASRVISPRPSQPIHDSGAATDDEDANATEADEPLASRSQGNSSLHRQQQPQPDASTAAPTHRNGRKQYVHYESPPESAFDKARWDSAAIKSGSLGPDGERWSRSRFVQNSAAAVAAAASHVAPREEDFDAAPSAPVCVGSKRPALATWFLSTTFRPAPNARGRTVPRRRANSFTTGHGNLDTLAWAAGLSREQDAGLRPLAARPAPAPSTSFAASYDPGLVPVPQSDSRAPIPHSIGPSLHPQKMPFFFGPSSRISYQQQPQHSAPNLLHPDRFQQGLDMGRTNMASSLGSIAGSGSTFLTFASHEPSQAQALLLGMAQAAAEAHYQHQGRARELFKCHQQDAVRAGGTIQLPQRPAGLVHPGPLSGGAASGPLGPNLARHNAAAERAAAPMARGRPNRRAGRAAVPGRVTGHEQHDDIGGDSQALEKDLSSNNLR